MTRQSLSEILHLPRDLCIYIIKQLSPIITSLRYKHFFKRRNFNILLNNTSEFVKDMTT